MNKTKTKIEKNSAGNTDIESIIEILSSFNSNITYRQFLELVLKNSIKAASGKSGFVVIKDKNNNYKIEDSIEINDNYAKNLLHDISVYFQIVFMNGKIKIIEELDDFDKGKKSKLLIPLIAEDNSVHAVVLVNNVNSKLNDKNKLKNFELLSIVSSQVLSKILIYNNMLEKIKLKDILIDISNSLEKVFMLKDAFDLVMKKLANNFNIIRGMLVLFEKGEFDNLSVFSAFNITEEEISRGIYKVGEGVIGKVVENGKPFSIQDINKDKLFLNKMKIKRNKSRQISFIAVPIKISGVVLGVLAIEKYFETNEKLADDEDMLFLISGIIADKVKIFQRMTEEKNVLLEENLNLKKELYEKYGIDNMIGKNKKIQDVFNLITTIADSNSSILILGSSGTGKELAAKAIHFNSSRRQEPFVSINCAAIPDNLLETELFGYKKGAFTGAGKDKKGKFLLADKGTLFLDEIGEMPLNLQAKLLRAVQEREIEPIGSELKIKIDIRIISATNRDPKDLIKAGKLREDLYYRLNVVEIKIPSLKERIDDIPLLIQHFIEKFSRENRRNIKRISSDALKIFQNYNWPGNVRELENVIERAVLLSKDETIGVNDLPDFIHMNEKEETREFLIEKWIENFIKNEKSFGKAYSNFMSVIEKEFLMKSLIMNERNKFKTANYLGINRNTLRSKLNDYDIRI